MQAPLTLRRPANWQDFEALCHKLWGEIWNYPEIQMHGRLGQEQSGVDIYGIPEGEEAYYGIQCKGKSEYNDNHPQFTEKEIEEEIEKAKTFEPFLKKLYFATTALNDSKIQAFVRKKNIENKNKGLFEVHIYSWELIASLIDSNQQTHDWYVKGQRYKTTKNVSITFDNNETEVTAIVPFLQTTINYRQKIIPAYQSLMGPILSLGNINNVGSIFSNQKNLSYFIFYLKIKNTGLDPIENYKIYLTFEGDFKEISTTTHYSGIPSLSIQNIAYNTFLDSENKTGTIAPLQNILVSDEVIGFDYIYIKPIHQPTKIFIHWSLISKDFKDTGTLTLNLIPDIKQKFEETLVDILPNPDYKVGPIEDYFE